MHQKGLELFQMLHGQHAGQQLIDDLQGICPDFGSMTIEWAMGGIMARLAWIY